MDSKNSEVMKSLKEENKKLRADMESMFDLAREAEFTGNEWDKYCKIYYSNRIEDESNLKPEDRLFIMFVESVRVNLNKENVTKLQTALAKYGDDIESDTYIELAGALFNVLDYIEGDRELFLSDSHIDEYFEKIILDLKKIRK